MRLPTYHVHIPKMNGESYRLKYSKIRQQRQLAQKLGVAVDPDTDPDTGEIDDS